MRASACNNRGFSLLEIIVAVLILSFISATIWVSLSSSLDVQEKTRSDDERIHEITVALDRIARDLSMAYLSRNQSSDKRTQTVFVGRKDHVDFTTFSHLKIVYDARESDQAEVGYFTQNRDGQTVLYRREDTVIDDRPDEGGTRLILADDIEALTLRYFDARTNNWYDDWDSQSIAQFYRMPSQIEVNISYRNNRDNIEVMTVRVNPMMQNAISL